VLREESEGGWLLVFPSQYRRERDIPGHPEIFVSYTFTGELQSIYTTLVVRLLVWPHLRTQGALAERGGVSRPARENDRGGLAKKVGEGEGKLSVFFEKGRTRN